MKIFNLQIYSCDSLKVGKEFNTSLATYIRNNATHITDISELQRYIDTFDVNMVLDFIDICSIANSLLHEQWPKKLFERLDPIRLFDKPEMRDFLNGKSRIDISKQYTKEQLEKIIYN